MSNRLFPLGVVPLKSTVIFKSCNYTLIFKNICEPQNTFSSVMWGVQLLQFEKGLNKAKYFMAKFLKKNPEKRCF